MKRESEIPLEHDRVTINSALAAIWTTGTVIMLALWVAILTGCAGPKIGGFSSGGIADIPLENGDAAEIVAQLAAPEAAAIVGNYASMAPGYNLNLGQDSTMGMNGAAQLLKEGISMGAAGSGEPYESALSDAIRKNRSGGYAFIAGPGETVKAALASFYGVVTPQGTLVDAFSGASLTGKYEHVASELVAQLEYQLGALDGRVAKIADILERAPPGVPEGDAPPPTAPSPGVPSLKGDGLWKPESDTRRGTAVALIDSGHTGHVDRSTVKANGQPGGFSSINNGNREHYRWGHLFNGPVKFTYNLKDGTPISRNVPNGRARAKL
jgi:hypothetical protein